MTNCNCPWTCRWASSTSWMRRLFRTRIDQAEHDIDDDQPLFVFDNHDNPRSWNRYGDGKHNLDIARVIATLLLGYPLHGHDVLRRRAGHDDHASHARRGCKGSHRQDRLAEGKRPRWRAHADAVGWLAQRRLYRRLPPRPGCRCRPSYKTVNVALESREDDSLLSWYQRLIQLRRENPALHDGTLTMLNVNDNNVLSWLRKSGRWAICSGRL